MPRPICGRTWDLYGAGGSASDATCRALFWIHFEKIKCPKQVPDLAPWREEGVLVETMPEDAGDGGACAKMLAEEASFGRV